MWEGIRWVVCIGLGSVFGLFLIGNWLSLIGTVKTKKPTSLVFPFISGPLCALACWVCPSPRLQSFWCVALVLDIGLLSLLGTVGATVIRLVRGRVSGGDGEDS